MIRIKQTGLPISGAHWSYGADYMRRVSKKSAAALCGMYPLPRMGYEVIVAIKPFPGFSTTGHRLVIHNISGDYFIASTDTSVSQWPETFGVEIVE